MILEVHLKDVASNATETRRFSESPVRIGRNQLNDIAIEDPFVSEWHGVIRFDRHGVAFVDMGSTNGTLLDGRRLPKNTATTLGEQSVLVLGRREVTVKPVEAAPPAQQTGGGFSKTIGLGQDIPALSPVERQAPVVVRSGPRGAVTQRRPEPPESQAPAPRAVAAEAPAVQAPAAAAPAADDALLRAFCEAFVGLRKGFEQFGSEVGVRIINGTTPLHRARTADEVLAHLRDPAGDPAAVAHEIIAIFADFGIHQIALMEGITEGVRALLQSLDPRAFELGGGGLFSGGKKAKAQLAACLEQFDQLVTHDEQLHGAIFGDEFARAYASVTRGGDDQDDE